MIEKPTRPKAVAWAGELMLCESRWTDKDGHTVKFRLVTPNEERPNPFKAFTKRRSGKAGTRFHMSAAHVVNAKTPTAIAYDGEAMLAGWSDTNSTGYCVTFWVQPRGDSPAHPFEGYTRNVDSFMVALVELGDDEVAVDQEKRDRVENPPTPTAEPTHPPVENPPTPSPETVGGLSEPTYGRKSQRLSTVAALMCANKDFLRYIGATDEHQAAHWMRTQLGIGSRAMLDDPTQVDLIQRFHDEIRKPFASSAYNSTPGYARA